MNKDVTTKNTKSIKNKAYPKYKPSGVEWLGDVPEHWGVKRLKYQVTINDETLPETTDPDFELLYVDISSVNPSLGIVQKESLLFENAPSRARRIVRNGDTIVSTVRTYLRAISPVIDPESNLIVSTGFAVIRPRKINQDYLSAAIQAPYFIEEVVSRSVGVSYPAINASEIGFISIPLPPFPEQQAIAAFLDRDTGRIDSLITKKQRLLELLTEQRTALISRAVTKGLDATVKLKPSGVGWLGDVPGHWGVKRLKDLLQEKKGAIKTGPFGSQLLSSEMYDEDVKVYNQKSVITNDFEYGENYISFEKFKDLKEFQTFPGDFLITTRGTIGRCAILPKDAEQGILHPCLMRLQTNKSRVFDRYLEILIEESTFILEQLKIKSNGTTIEVIYQDSLKNVTVLLPPLTEQQTIAAFLDRETAKIDTLSAKVVTVIERLKEYRTALISSAVTGKIDVREAV